MTRTNFSQRASELHISESRPSSSRWWRIAAMVLVGIAVMMWSREAFAPAPQEWVLKPVPRSADTGWVDVLKSIDSSRNRAVELRDVTSLEKAVHRDGPAFVEESGLIERLVTQDIRVSGLKYIVLSVQERFRRWNGLREFVELEVRDKRAGFVEIDARGKIFEIEARPERQWRVTLMRESANASWRLWRVGASS